MSHDNTSLLQLQQCRGSNPDCGLPVGPVTSDSRRSGPGARGARVKHVLIGIHRLDVQRGPDGSQQAVSPAGAATEGADETGRPFDHTDCYYRPDSATYEIMDGVGDLISSCHGERSKKITLKIADQLFSFEIEYRYLVVDVEPPVFFKKKYLPMQLFHRR